MTLLQTFASSRVGTLIWMDMDFEVLFLFTNIIKILIYGILYNRSCCVVILSIFGILLLLAQLWWKYERFSKPHRIE